LCNHRVVLPWCTKALAFIELPVDNVNSQSFNVSFAVHRFVRNLLWQKCWGSKNQSHFSNRERFSMLCHTLERVACAAHQAVVIKAKVGNFSILACIFWQLRHFIEQCEKSRVFLNIFLSSVE
jgi:hypothetical protein